jgi:hypothetical protein
LIERSYATFLSRAESNKGGVGILLAFYIIVSFNKNGSFLLELLFNGVFSD